MKEIPLTQDKVAIVDSDWYEMLSQVSWYVTATGYAARSSSVNGKQHMERMHRMLIDAPKGMQVDHINGDPLDNRISNLRVCTQAENLRNQRKFHGNSIYKGVCWVKARGRWHATIKTNYKQKFLGSFDSELEAAKAYNEAALEYHGEFARLNKLP